MKDVVTPYIDGEPNEDAPLLVFVKCMFSGGVGFKDSAADFLGNMLQSIADEIEIVGAVVNGEDGLDHSDAVERCLARVHDRAKLSVEIARRIQRDAGGEDFRGMVAASQGRPVDS